MGPGPKKWRSAFPGLSDWCGDQLVSYSEPETFAESAGIEADNFLP